jgi:hypothetical protein
MKKSAIMFIDQLRKKVKLIIHHTRQEISKVESSAKIIIYFLPGLNLVKQGLPFIPRIKSNKYREMFI